MSLFLQVILFLTSLFTFVFIIRKIRNSQVQVDDALFWILFAALVLLVSIFPQIFIEAAELIGVISAANLVFLFFIFVLLIKCFSLSIRISQMDTKLKELTQQLGIEKLERHSNDNRHA